MKLKLFILLLFFSSVMAFGQNNIIVQGSPNTKIINKGWLQVDSGINIPQRDTAALNMNLVIFGNDLYYKGSSGAWLKGNSTNQTLSLSGENLSISGGNTVTIPLYERQQSFTGIATNNVTLNTSPTSISNVFIFYNNAFLDPEDWDISGSTITLSFTTTTNDLLTIYYR